ncbi:Flp pilus assembly protein CpaB [Sphingomonas sp. HDW15A]|uniref:Flp pilus assembly protein CpaB n=1 Tax=Sphingomonas sp. HDW15A TaxID=2714942 RepID=UPI00140DC7F4|nr:Flp pilus assembly protein CpaB [Sphingomonas sp. HDW15A]QIK95670.1 Flp pilus assembly protein CpaB [Sphingomonas sp. HDW15A]
MRRQTIIALAVAVVIGLVAVYLANSYWSARDAQADSAAQGTVRVAVASVPLDYGMPVTADKVRFASYPASSLPPGVYRTMNDLIPQGKARVALRPIQPNQLLLSSDLTGEGEHASIAALLPDGKRAASVRINDVSGVAGFIKPNDTVDVLITRQAIGENRDAQVTDVLLQNIRVIAMDQQSANKDAQPAVARVATLEVAPLDAQKLALGQQIGTLSLVLRKPGEEQNVAYVDTVSLEDLRFGAYGPPSSAARPAMAMAVAAPAAQAIRTAAPARPRPVRRAASASSRPRSPASDSVVVVRGTVTQNYEVRRNGQ